MSVIHSSSVSYQLSQALLQVLSEPPINISSRCFFGKTVSALRRRRISTCLETVDVGLPILGVLIDSVHWMGAPKLYFLLQA